MYDAASRRQSQAELDHPCERVRPSERRRASRVPISSSVAHGRRERSSWRRESQASVERRHRTPRCPCFRVLWLLRSAATPLGTVDMAAFTGRASFNLPEARAQGLGLFRVISVRAAPRLQTRTSRPRQRPRDRTWASVIAFSRPQTYWLPPNFWPDNAQGQAAAVPPLRVPSSRPAGGVGATAIRRRAEARVGNGTAATRRRTRLGATRGIPRARSFLVFCLLCWY